MKRVALIMLAIAGLTFTGNQLKAQESFASAGLELTLPMGDFSDVFPFGAGLSLQYEFGVTRQFSVTGNVGYTYLTLDSDLKDFYKNGSFIPIQFGGKYYLDKQRSGLFLAAQLGVHIVSITTEDIEFFGVKVEGETNSETEFSFAPEVGYFVNENVSLALRFNLITTDGDNINYLGLRAAYNF